MVPGPFNTQDNITITSLGTEFALTEILSVGAGYWLDKKFGTLPWCLLGGAIMGFIVGFWRIVQVAKSANKNLKQAKKHGRS